MICICVKPTSDFPYPARVPSYVAGEDNPERKPLFDFTFLANNLSKSGREIFAQSFMGIAPACTPGKSLYPAILTLYLNEYFLACFCVFYRQVRLKTMSICYAGVINPLFFFCGQWKIFINLGKLFRLISYSVTGVSEQIDENAVNARFNFPGQSPGYSLPICAYMQFILPH